MVPDRNAILARLTNRQIGERMYLAEKTVKNYICGLFTKLGMERRTQAAAYAARVFEKQDSPGTGAPGPLIPQAAGHPRGGTRGVIRIPRR
jgi:hypothetical protein